MLFLLYILAVTNNASINISVYICVCGYMLLYLWVYTQEWSGVARVSGSFVFNFLKNFEFFPKVAVPFYVPTSSWKRRVPISPHPHQNLLSNGFDDCHSGGCEVVSLVIFMCISLIANWLPWWLGQ